MSTVTDSQLVNAYVSGDRSALAGMYDRYGAMLYDTAAAMTRSRHDAADVVQDVFVTAAERLDQLRDPTRLKPWLFAILRNEVYRRTERGRRAVPTDFSEPTADMRLPPAQADATAGVEYDELATLVRSAAAGLDERDQLVLELSVRQGLDGADLADALGVSTQQSYGLVHRMRQRTERSLAAFCVARRGRAECDELAKILHGWDEQFSVLIRKRVARHIDRCDICERTRKTVVPLALFAGAPAFAAPAGLRDRVLAATADITPAARAGIGGSAVADDFGRPGGFPSALRPVRKLALAVLGAAAIVLLTAGGAVYVWADGSDGRVATAPAGSTSTTSPPITTREAAPGAAATTPSNRATTLPPATTVTSPSIASSTTTAITDPITDPTTRLPITTSATPTVDAGPTATTPTEPPGPAPTPTAPTPTAPTAPAPTPTTPTATAPTPTAPIPTTPGSLQLSAGTVDLGRTRTSATVTLSNPGGAPMTWYSYAGPLGFRGTSSPFSISPVQGELAPGTSTTVTIAVDRSWPTEGPTSRAFTFYGDGADATVVATAAIARPPVMRLVPPPTHVCRASRSSWISWQAGISDESPPITAGITIVTPAGRTAFEPLRADADTYVASFDLDRDGDGVPDPGVYDWTASAVDGFGNRTTESGTVSVGTDPTHC